ncbi:aldose 1-epimerase family protein [Roseicitreum antarcticum]|uniref:Monosaccharide-transporting ATPase n=1 Tax=Roseicitreum antarcticum TaxID=564137 RepID=A0A1H2YV88_9RHOB|nr:aldose 1-epimerase family protein [Roseicitreum antarcticum]SDX09090.1 monosaccharide-transporting ATPase [Roseicitreum antarcticum]
MTVIIPLTRAHFGPARTELARRDDVTVTGWRTALGIEMLEIMTPRGRVELLPYLGQMLWDATFDGVRLTMHSAFAEPRPAQSIVDTYGCLAYHSGLLRNGCPGPQDDHPLHGEMACAAMDSAWLEIGTDADGGFVRLGGQVDFIRGFGPHYRAMPSITLRDGSLIEMAMAVENRSGLAMELMYMCHVNFAFVTDGRIHQMAPFTPERTRVRRDVPAHVQPTPAYRSFIDRLAVDPTESARLDQPDLWNPEQVLYVEQPGTDHTGESHALLERPEGDGFVMSWRPEQFSHLARWILKGEDASVAAFALPATCEPEGYTAEKAKGNVRSLAPGETARFATRFGYTTQIETAELAKNISAFGEKEKTHV